MKRIIQYSTIICCLFVINNSFSQTTEQLVKAYLYQSADRLNLTEDDLKEWKIYQSYEGDKSKITHVYGVQMYKGLEISNTDFNLHIVEGDEVLKFQNNFISNLISKTQNTPTAPKLSSVEAVNTIAGLLNLNITEEVSVINTPIGAEQKQLLSTGGISVEEIPAKLMYFLDKDDQLKLVWDISIHEIGGQDWWNIKLDADSGTILEKKNWVAECKFHDHGAVANLPMPEEAYASFEEEAFNSTSNMLMGTYNVYAMPIESPNHGGRTLEVNPDNFLASPFGWHDFTFTQGNNVDAYEDGDNPGFRPNGGGSYNFNFPVSFPYSAGNQSESAAITNLFYWNNIIHDVLYQYGFTEASGNFQEDNYGRGGGGALASDYVNARSQAGLLCNAFFGTPPDGSNPTMSMFVGNCGAANRDGSFDNPVIAHEYGHGISNRLVGGPSNVGCLSNNEQMGEGWSDWYGLMLTMESTHSGTDSRGIGTWLFGQAANGPGIRAFPYSTDMTVDPRTYNSIIGTGGPHPLGSVWAAMLWEVSWELINIHGYDADFYNGTGGNNIAMHLVTEGLKLTSCSPGFVDGRDAILLADQMIYGGANQCAIWKAFAKRGLGVGASQGSSASRNDGVEAYDVPVACCPANLNITTDVPSFTVDHQEASNTITASNTVLANARAIYHAGGTVILEEEFAVDDNSDFAAYIEGCTGSFVLSAIGKQREKIDLSYLGDEKVVKKAPQVAEGVILYPNPADQYFDITITGATLIKIEIFDINARKLQVYELEDTESVYRVNTNVFGSGVYFVNILDSNNNVHIKRIIIN